MTEQANNETTSFWTIISPLAFAIIALSMSIAAFASMDGLQYSCSTFHAGTEIYGAFAGVTTICAIISSLIFAYFVWDVKSYRKYAIVAVVCILAVSMYVPDIGAAFSGITRPTLYYSGENITGVYSMNIYAVNNLTAYAAMCPSSGGDLHGSWNYREGLNIEPGYYDLKVVNGVITEIVREK